MKGFIGDANEKGLFGWVKGDQEDKPLEVSYYINDRYILSSTADIYRLDIQVKGLHPTGYCGFRLLWRDVPFIPAGPFTVLVKAGPDQEVVHGSPFQVHDLSQIAADGLPLPPARLRFKAIGNDLAEKYLASLKHESFAIKIDKLLGETSYQSLKRVPRIFDFGCGNGRLLRNFFGKTDGELIGCDIDEESILWAKSHLSQATFLHTGEYPPLPFDEGYFDLVYAISVFTHLDEHHQHLWLEELRRVTRPGGILFLSFKEKKANWSQEEQRNQAKLQKGFHFEQDGYWQNYFPAYYQSTYISEAYIKEVWGQYFTIEKILTPGLLVHQAVAMLRNDSG